MKLSVWARQNGIAYKTAWRMFKENRLPHPTKQLPTGTILIFPEQQNQALTQVVLYARVSSRKQKMDLDRQLQRLRDYAAQEGYSILNEVMEIGSGLNGRRKKLLRLLQDLSQLLTPDPRVSSPLSVVSCCRACCYGIQHDP